MPGYEGLYEISEVGKVKALDREVVCNGKSLKLKQNQIEVKKKGNTLYALIRDKDFKNRKVNLTSMIKNVFGRQRPIKPVKKRESVKERYIKNIVKPANTNGPKGISVEQWDENKLIKVFETFAAAANAVGGEYRHVSDCCYGKRSYYAGFKWKFHN